MSETDDPANAHVVGIFYNRAHQGPLAAEVETLRLSFPDIRVVLGHYEDPPAIRRVRCLDPVPDAIRAQVPSIDPDQRALLAQVDAILTLDLPFDVRALAPKLQWVQSIGAGTNHLHSAGLAEAGIRLAGNGGANAVSIAEFVVGRILQVVKRFRAIEEAQAQQHWLPLFGGELAGQTVGLIGLGAINTHVATLLKAFGMRVIALRRSGRSGPAVAAVDEIYEPGELHAMLGQCQIVISAVPESPETIGIMDAASFAAMQEGSLFCNVGRGSLVDEAALIAALESRHLAAAILDVTTLEPLPSDHALWGAPNIYLSAHCASNPMTMMVNVHRIFRENIARFREGGRLASEVDLRTKGG